MYAINVLRIFEIIGSGAGFQIDNPAKSSGKNNNYDSHNLGAKGCNV